MNTNQLNAMGHIIEQAITFSELFTSIEMRDEQTRNATHNAIMRIGVRFNLTLGELWQAWDTALEQAENGYNKQVADTVQAFKPCSAREAARHHSEVLDNWL